MSDPKPLVGHARTRANLCARGDHPLRGLNGQYHTDFTGGGYCCACASCPDAIHEKAASEPKVKPTTDYGKCSVCGELMVYGERLARIEVRYKADVESHRLIHERHLKIESESV